MRTGNCQPRAVAFDPYGEPLERELLLSPGGRRARAAATAVFWTLALMLVVGRIYLDPKPTAQTLAAATGHLAASVATR